jgi:hypothetical protein
VVHLDVLENGDKKESAENPGGQKIMADLGGAKSGLPFFAIVDSTGKKLGDSNMAPGGQNIGYPATKGEIASFIKLLKSTAPHLAESQLAALEKDLTNRSPERARQ